MVPGRLMAASWLARFVLECTHSGWMIAPNPWLTQSCSSSAVTARRPLGLAQDRARLPGPAPREPPASGVLRACRAPRRGRPPARPVAGRDRRGLLLRLAQRPRFWASPGTRSTSPGASCGCRPTARKTRTGRILPLSQPIAAALARRSARRDPDSPLVFHRDGNPHPAVADGLAHRLSGGRRPHPVPP